MVDVGAGDSGFVGAALVGEGDVAHAGDGAHQQGVERQHRREGRVAVEVPFAVEPEQFGVDLPLEDDDVVLCGEAGDAGAFEGGTARVDDEWHNPVRAAVVFQCHHRVLAAPDGHDDRLAAFNAAVGEVRH